MKLEALTVSVDYSDFLKYAIDENSKLFDKWVIVTNKTDEKTKKLCEGYANIICVQTDVFYENGASFNKYAGINEGLKYISNNAWVLFLDSDIILHYETRRILRLLNLNEDYIYGIDRVNCVGAKRWKEYMQKRDMLRENWLLSSVGMEFGSRLVHYYGHEGENGRFEGRRPLGFFQLCHRSAFIKYPDRATGADNCDLEFARLWKRKYRMLIPELLAIHLESDRSHKGVNWYGRKSQPFIVEEEIIIIEEIKEEYKKY